MNPNDLTKSSLLLIYTGGTIGMKEDPQDQTLKPFDFSQILDEVPEIRKFAFRIDSYTFDPLIDSSDVEPSLWQRLAELIYQRYDEYDGFIILHGTDTMSYSASALSFMLDGLTKPVVFTGSQLPIGVPRTDGKENLISAVEIASAKDAEGHALVPEVCVCFDSLLMRGNRTTKVNAEVFRAFQSPNLPPLAEAGISIRYNKDIIRKPLDWYQNLSINTKLDTRVSILKIHPGITAPLLRSGDPRRHPGDLRGRERPDGSLVHRHRPGSLCGRQGGGQRYPVPGRFGQHVPVCHREGAAGRGRHQRV